MGKKEIVNEREVNKIKLMLISFSKLQFLQFRLLSIITSFHMHPF